MFFRIYSSKYSCICETFGFVDGQLVDFTLLCSIIVSISLPPPSHHFANVGGVLSAVGMVPRLERDARSMIRLWHPYTHIYTNTHPAQQHWIEINKNNVHECASFHLFWTPVYTIWYMQAPRYSQGHTESQSGKFLHYYFVSRTPPSFLRCSPLFFYRGNSLTIPFPSRPWGETLCIHDISALHCWALCEK